MAGFITLMNSARVAAGKPLLGFVNPLLYSADISVNSANYASNFYDITSGINSCFGTSATVGGQLLCCVNANKQLYGFSAVTGWDPATGLGTINFKNLKQAIGVLPTILTPTYAPTSATTDTPLYLFVNGVAYADYMTSPIVFKNQIANAVAYVLTLSSSQVFVTATAYSTGRRRRSRALLGSAGQSVLVQMTVTSSMTSQNVLLSLNNAISNGLLTTALTSLSNAPSACPSCITTAFVNTTAYGGTAPTSALTAMPPSSAPVNTTTTGHLPTLAPVSFAPISAPTDTPLYLPVNGVSYGDYMTSPIVFKNQIANAVAYVLAISASQVFVTAIAYSTGRRTRTRALLGTASQSVLVQMTVTSSMTSQNVLLSLNNAISNGLLTTALTTGQNSFVNIL